jgi:hypothetical protein
MFSPRENSERDLRAIRQQDASMSHQLETPVWRTGTVLARKEKVKNSDLLPVHFQPIRIRAVPIEWRLRRAQTNAPRSFGVRRGGIRASGDTPFPSPG